MINRVFQEGRLADSGLAAYDERLAAAQPRSAEQLVDERTLELPTDERRPHGRGVREFAHGEIHLSYKTRFDDSLFPQGACAAVD